MQATAQQLKEIVIFSSLDLTLLFQLAQGSQITAYEPGETIIGEGERFQPKLYAVLKGKLLVQKVSATGKETILRQLPAGEMFAAPALFGDGIAPATVMALQASQVVTVAKTDLLAAIQSTPEIALQILSCFNQRLQEMHQTIHGLVSERAIVRLARIILYTAERDGVERTHQGTCLTTKLPYQQMARMIGITYEECVRLVNKRLNTMVEYSRGGVITILDAGGLGAIAADTASI